MESICISPIPAKEEGIKNIPELSLKYEEILCAENVNLKNYEHSEVKIRDNLEHSNVNNMYFSYR